MMVIDIKRWTTNGGPVVDGERWTPNGGPVLPFSIDVSSRFSYMFMGGWAREKIDSDKG